MKDERPRIHTIVIVVANHNLLYLAILAHLTPKVFVESIKVILQLTRVHIDLWVIRWVLIEIGKENGLRVRWFDMFP